MKDNDIARLVNNLKQVAVECHGHGSLREKISKLIVPAVKGHTVMEWISVKDKLPKETGRYWCHVKEVNDLGESSYQWNVCYNEWEKAFHPDNNDKVTHWMPLPEPPKE